MIRSPGMLVVAVTGGIGSGKSTVASLLESRGAVVIDTDVVAREVVEPGQPAHAAVVERFGPGVLSPDGAVDRAALAEVVFGDRAALADLNAIVHPPVRRVVEERVAARAGGDDVVVVVVPLLVESGWHAWFDVVVVVDCPEDVAARRLLEHRGMDETDVRRRLAAQATRAARLAVADHVVRNDGSIDALSAEVDRAWRWLDSLAHRTGDTERRQGDDERHQKA